MLNLSLVFVFSLSDDSAIEH